MTYASLLGVLFGTCECKGPFDCMLSIDRTGGIFFWFAIMLYMFKALGTLCDEYLLSSLEVIEDKLKVSPDLAAATLQAVGSSAPEMFTSLICTFLLVNEGGIGLVLGSAVFNILVVNGVTAYASHEADGLYIWWYPLLRDGFFLAASIVELAFFIADGEVLWWESLIMLATYGCYVLVMYFNQRIMTRYELVSPEDEAMEELTHAKWGRCPMSHKLEPITAYKPGQCGRCGGTIKTKEVTLECRKCDEPWWVCGKCFARQRKQELAERRRLQETAEAENATMLPNMLVEEPPTDDIEAAEDELEAEAQRRLDAHTGLGSKHAPISVYGAGASIAADPSQQEHTAHGMRGADEEDLEGSPAGGGTRELGEGTPPSGGGAEPSEREPWYPVGTHVRVLKVASKKRRRGVVAELDRTKVKVCYNRGWPEDEWLDEESLRLSRDLRCGCCAWICDDEEDEDTFEEDENLKRGGEREQWPGYMRFLKDPLPWLCRKLLPRGRKHCWSICALAALLISMASYVMVDSSMRIGQILRLPPRVIGLTLLASGTSITDVLGSVAVAKGSQDEQGNTTRAIANSLGGHIFTILVGLGVPWTFNSLATGKVELPQKDALLVDTKFLAGAAGAFLFLLVVQGFYLTKWSGIVLIIVNSVYVIYLLASSGGDMPP